MFEKKLLNHGYLKLVERWGSDQSVIEGARMSTDKGFLGWGPRCAVVIGAAATSPHADLPCGLPCVEHKGAPHCERHGGGVPTAAGDEKLLAYLWKNKHSTPFEMGGLTIEVQAPIFVFREWHRHRVPFGYSELSARYTPMPNLNYVPTLERCHLGGGHLTKQAGTIQGAAELTDEAALDWLERLDAFYAAAEALYQHGLGIGLPKELARIVVPVGRYSRMRATGNLRGWLAFMGLRDAPGAQYEIRVFAQAVGEILAAEFPRTWSLFKELPL